MLTPEYLDRLPEEAVELYASLEESIIRDIVRRLVKTGQITESARWQIDRLQNIGLLYDEIIKRIAELSESSEEQIRALFEEAAVENMKFDAKIYKSAGRDPPLKLSPAALQVLQAGIYKTHGNLQNLTMTTAVASQQAYIQAATKAEMQVTSGAFDYVTAIRNAIKQTAKDGVTVLYPSGHVDKLDVAVRRAVLTGANQTAAAISLTHANDMQCDLIETSAHAGARPSHIVWQGKIFSRSGQNRKYPDFVSSTGYGTGAGLCGWNCRHSFYPFFEGLSESAYPRKLLDEYNRKTVMYHGQTIPYYDATQMQRKMERQIRASKCELAALQEGMKTTDNATLANALQAEYAASALALAEHRKSLADFLTQTGLTKQGWREQVEGFGRSQAAKASAAIRKRKENK